MHRPKDIDSLGMPDHKHEVACKSCSHSFTKHGKNLSAIFVGKFIHVTSPNRLSPSSQLLITPLFPVQLDNVNDVDTQLNFNKMLTFSSAGLTIPLLLQKRVSIFIEPGGCF